MVTCPSCAATDCVGKFCKYCGARLPLVCSTAGCGEVLTSKFCRGCGEPNPTFVTPLTSPTSPFEGRKVNFERNISSSESQSRKPKAPPICASSVRSLRSLQTIDWRRGNMLGKGSFGTVYLGMMTDGRLSAVKCVELGNASNENVDKDIKQLVDEIKFMAVHSHPNIVSYFGCSYNKVQNCVEVFLEYVAGGSIANLRKQFGDFPPNAIKFYTTQILEGLDYLHSCNIAHRDIKGDNILVGNDGTVKLADFGCSKQMNDICVKTHGCSTMVGTPYWMAPEVIKQESTYGLKADVWSVGCTVLEMITGQHPWPEFNTMWAAIWHIANSTEKPPNIPEDLDPDAADFLDQTFRRDVALRPSAKELLLHPYLVTDDD